MATDDRRAAAAAIQKAYATADRLGAQPLAQKAAALAHRARLSPAPSTEGGEQAPAGQPGHGRRAAPVRAHRPGAPGARDAGPGPIQSGDRKGAAHERQNRQRAHVQDSSIPVLGVAKSRIRTATHVVPVVCGSSARLLFVTAAGMPAAEAADLVRPMADWYRCPTHRAGPTVSLADLHARGMRQMRTTSPRSADA